MGNQSDENWRCEVPTIDEVPTINEDPTLDTGSRWQFQRFSTPRLRIGVVGWDSGPDNGLWSSTQEEFQRRFELLHYEDGCRSFLGVDLVLLRWGDEALDMVQRMASCGQSERRFAFVSDGQPPRDLDWRGLGASAWFVLGPGYAPLWDRVRGALSTSLAPTTPWSRPRQSPTLATGQQRAVTEGQARQAWAEAAAIRSLQREADALVEEWGGPAAACAFAQERALESLLARKYQAAVRFFDVALMLDPTEVRTIQFNLERLKQMGYVSVHAAQIR